MNLDQFDYSLPSNLIAQFPLPDRSASRLLHFHAQGSAFADLHFTDLPGLLRPHDVLVFNNTKVVPARLYGNKDSGGKVELLMERMLDLHKMLAQIKASKSPKVGTRIHFKMDVSAEIIDRQGDFFIIEFDEDLNVGDFLEQHGHVPLPPYIIRGDEPEDKKRYQTIYARQKGAVAAPTAGLHFDNPMLDQLRKLRVDLAFLTLHVGAGTFQPVRVEQIEEHAIHAERIIVPQKVCDQIKDCKAKGGRVIAVGTTSVRALETAAQAGEMAPYDGDTSLFIYPGFEFRVVDALTTNFHLPKSSLLMLVSAFAGYETTMAAYHHAVKEQYRFYSYGDAMFIER